jgi:hypothetical protein
MGQIAAALLWIWKNGSAWVLGFFGSKAANAVIGAVAIGGAITLAWSEIAPHLATAKAAWMEHVLPHLEIANAWIPVTFGFQAFSAYVVFALSVTAARWAMGVSGKSE